MIEITSPAALRSLIQEAGRQSEFFHRRGDEEVANMWVQIEGLAFEAKALRDTVVITRREMERNPIPIMPCGPSEEVKKGFSPKVL